jgi:hypothetical protein
VVDALRGIADNPADAELLTEVAMTAPGLGRLLPGIQRAGQGGLAGDDLDQLWRWWPVGGCSTGCSPRSRAGRRPTLSTACVKRSGVLVTDSRSESYVFRHALLQEAVYGDLLPGEQVRLHAAYGRILASAGSAAAELAYHCPQSHDLAGALAASVGAAGEAEAVLAPIETLRHLSGALRLWERVPDPAC